MKNLGKEYEVHRKDLKTKDKKLIKKHSDVLKKHKFYDVRIEKLSDKENKKPIKIKSKSIETIFELINDKNVIIEEHALFLFLCEKKRKTSHNSLNINDSELIDSSVINVPSSSERAFIDERNKNSIFEIDETTNDTSIRISMNEKKMKNKISIFFCVFSVIFFIEAVLLFYHLLKFFLSDQVSYIIYLLLLYI